jgi:hypothetical protein
MDDYSDGDETEMNPSPRTVPTDPERKPGGESLSRLITLPSTVGEGTGDQPSAVSCLTGDGDTESPVTPSRQVTLRKSTSARSVLSPPPLDIEGC